jgi:hypothetical protein
MHLISITASHEGGSQRPLIFVIKATGIDGISPKLLHFAKPFFVKPLTDIVNLSVSTSTFPDRLMEAQVAPIH